jgi:predicted N-acetyltransferase YhbS
MAELVLETGRTTSHLRPLDVRRDLLAVADLIELCFANTMDADGREYLRKIRRAGREADMLRWVPSVVEPAQLPMSGLVWEKDNRVVGNLTLIPFYRSGRRIFLIANVAVHPNYRRQGIARALTSGALEQIQKQSGREAWLQVRADNTSAYNIYCSLGFQERARRITWQATPDLIERSSVLPINEALTSIRRSSDWPQQSAWLAANYPEEVIWNTTLSVHRFIPGFWRDLMRQLSGPPIQHWAARRNGILLGLLTWEPSRTSADNLWLAAPPESEDEAIRILLPRATSHLSTGRPLSLNYIAGRGEAAIQACGFKNQQTLIWMNVLFK